jgi:hypothetical protein
MIEKTLIEKLTKIFDVPRATFDRPTESAEQDILFIMVDSAKSSIKEKRHIARITGRIVVYSTHEKLPYGFFYKQLAEANASDTLDFFFFDFEENTGRGMNIVERSLGFVYFYSGQYDPEIGTIDSINLSVQVSE